MFSTKVFFNSVRLRLIPEICEFLFFGLFIILGGVEALRKVRGEKVDVFVELLKRRLLLGNEVHFNY